ncbi:hypothetical protein BGZ68_009495 [Mortierella alpina]|nr:hypothetical protein BGZ68_009495 [Mortierella alpina]
MAALLFNAHSDHNTSIDPITYIQQTHRVRRAADARVQTPEALNAPSRRTMSPLGISIGGASLSVKNFLRRKKGNTNTGNGNNNSEQPQSSTGSRPLAMQSFMIVRDNSSADTSESVDTADQYSDLDRQEAYRCPSYSYPSYPSPLLSPSQCQSPMREVVSPMMSSTSLSPVLQATVLVQPTMTTTVTTPAPMTSFSQTMKAHFTRDRSRSRSLSMSATDSSSPSTPPPSSVESTSSRQSRKCRHRAVVLVDADFANYYNTDPANWTWSNSNTPATSHDDSAKNISSTPSNGGADVVRKQLNRRSLSVDCLPKVTQDHIPTYQDTRGVVKADNGSAHTYAFRYRPEQHSQSTVGPTSRLHTELVSDPDEGHDDQDMDVGNCSMSSGEILAWMPEATDMPSDSLCGIASAFKSRLRAEGAEEEKHRNAYRTSVALLTAEILHQTGSTLTRSDSNSSNISCSTAASSDASTVIHDQDILDTNIQELRRNKSKRRDAVKCVEGQEPTTISMVNNEQEEQPQQLMTCGDKIYLVSGDSSPTHFYDSPQVREALRLFLASNGCEFEDMIDNGFPSEVFLNNSNSDDDEDDEVELEDDESAPDHCRYLTLRITLTPWHSRADEADLYGPEVESEAPQEIRSMMSELFSRAHGANEANSPSPSVDLAPPSKVPTDAFTRSDSAFSSATTALDGRSSSSSVNTSRNSSRNSSLKRESKSGMKQHLVSLPINIVTRGDMLDRGHETSSPSPSSLSSSASSSSSSTPASSPCASPPISPSIGPHRKSSSSAVFYFPAVSYIAEAEASDDQKSDITPRPINSLPRPLLPRMMSDQSDVKSEGATATRHLYNTRPQSTQARRSRRYPYHIHILQQGSAEDDEDSSNSPPVSRAPYSAGSRPRPLSPPSSVNNESEEIEIYKCYHVSNLDHLYKADGNGHKMNLDRPDTTSKPQQLHFDKPVVMSLSRQGTRLVQAQGRRGADAHLQTKNAMVNSAPPPLSAKSLRRREVGRRQVIVPSSDTNASPPSSTRSQRSQSPMEDEFVSTADLSWEVYSIYSKGRGNQDLSPIIYGHEEIAAHTDGCWRPVPCRLAPETKMFSFP